MKHRSRNPLIATVGLGALLIAYAARASFLGIPDGDSASLIQLLVTSMRQLNTLNDQLGTIRQTYAETKKLAGYTEDAVAAFQGLARADFSDGVQILEDAVPNLRYFDREAHHLNSWTQGQGEFIALMRSCVRAVQRNGEARARVAENQAAPVTLSTIPTCNDLDRELSGAHLAELILRDFGPPRTPAQLRVDQVAADALGHSAALHLRDTTLEQDWKSYEEYCFASANGGLLVDLDDSIMDRCQAAEILVQLRSARETQILRGEVRQLKDIEAYRLLGENGERKQQTEDRAREQQQVLDGATHMTAPEIRMTAPGFDLRGDR